MLGLQCLCILLWQIDHQTKSDHLTSNDLLEMVYSSKCHILKGLQLSTFHKSKLCALYICVHIWASINVGFIYISICQVNISMRNRGKRQITKVSIMSIFKPTYWILTEDEETCISHFYFRWPWSGQRIKTKYQVHYSSNVHLLKGHVSCLYVSPPWRIVGKRQHCNLSSTAKMF